MEGSRPLEQQLSPPRPHERVTARASAKVNLCLAVGPLREDGFHELQTVYTAVSLVDEVDVVRADAPSVSLSGEGEGEVPLDGGNLALRAVALLAEETGQDPGVAVTIRKGIPVAAGLAGGSADAAAALVACDALWGLGLSRDELGALGARLGSDVPFALHGGTALGTGRGEQLTEVLGKGTWHWVLALAAGGLSTPAVYRRLDELRATHAVQLATDAAQVLAAVRTGDHAVLGAALVNDLQDAALDLRPDLQQVLRAAHETGASGAVVSGSGPTVAALCGDASTAERVASALRARGVARAVRVASGPAPGARVVAAR